MTQLIMALLALLLCLAGIVGGLWLLFGYGGGVALAWLCGCMVLAMVVVPLIPPY